VNVGKHRIAVALNEARLEAAAGMLLAPDRLANPKPAAGAWGMRQQSAAPGAKRGKTGQGV